MRIHNHIQKYKFIKFYILYTWFYQTILLNHLYHQYQMHLHLFFPHLLSLIVKKAGNNDATMDVFSLITPLYPADLKESKIRMC